MLSGLTLWYLAINGYVLFAEDHFSHSQLSSVAYTPFCKVEASLALLCLVWHILLLSLHLDSHAGKTLCNIFLLPPPTKHTCLSRLYPV